MKSFLPVVVFTLLALFAGAQDTVHHFKRFRVDVSVGYAVAEGGGEDVTKAGFVIAIEPKFALLHNLNIGVRIEPSWLALQTNYETADVDVEATAAGSYSVTGDIYFNNRYKFHPFGGAGIGLFTLGRRSIDFNGNPASPHKLGGFLRLGAELKHFRLSGEYNAVPSTYHQVDNRFGRHVTLVSNSYVGIKAGIFLGGGRKKR